MHNNTKLPVPGFTLVELIVVVTILAILGTIGFISLNDYSSRSKDVNRKSNLTLLRTGIELFKTTSSRVPNPDSAINLTASGTEFGFQGKTGKGVQGKINVSEQTILDPEYKIPLTSYATNSNLTEYQLTGYFNGNDGISSNLLPIAVANSSLYAKKSYITVGDGIGTLVYNSGANKDIPVEDLGASINLILDTSEFRAILGDKNSVTGTGKTIFTQLYNSSNNRIKNKELAKFDESLVGYWDLETLTGSQFRDFSKNNNHGNCSLGNTGTTPCGSGNFSLVGGKNSSQKGVQFNAQYDMKIITGTGGMDSTKPYTIYAKLKIDNFNNQAGILFVDNETCNRYLFSSTWKRTGSLDGSHVGTCRSDGGWGTATSEDTTFYLANNWYDVAFIVNPMTGNIKAYRDGMLIQNLNFTPFSQFSGTPRNIWIGGSNENPVYTMNGIIDEIRLYNRILSEEEIQNLSEASGK